MYIKTLLVTMFLLCSFAVNAELTLIVNPANSNNVDKETVKRLFLGKQKSFADGSEATPVNLSTDNPLRQTFDKEILGRNSAQISAYWSKLVFTGKGTPPKDFATDAEVVKMVASNPNYIGYVDSSVLDGSVKGITLN